MRSLPEAKTERIYVYHMDYRCDPWDEPEIYETHSLLFKIHVQFSLKSVVDITKIPVLTTPVLKKSEPTPVAPVTITSTPIDADDIICIENKTF